MSELPTLHSTFSLGPLELQNRAVMAPMTRSRAIDNVPNDLMAEYYGQRSEVGLIITEGTAPSPNGLGYARIPGIYSPEQVAGWKKVTAAAHDGGAKIFVQLMHVGRIAHADNLPEGAEVVAPSAIAAAGEMYTDTAGPQAHPTPRAMTEEDIARAVQEYVQAAVNAREAGFDGIELHAANGYLIDQFLNPRSNQRTDAWGGSAGARNRFALEVAKATADAIGKERVGIRVSPHGVFNDLGDFDETASQYAALAKGLGELGLAYVHIVDHSSMGTPPVPAETKAGIRENFGGPIILSGGYDGERAEAALTAKEGELVAFGRPYLANPDLLARYRSGAPLAEANMEKAYTPGPEGYTDYPTR
jgi:N-ethylmaleimide reductase